MTITEISVIIMRGLVIKHTNVFNLVLKENRKIKLLISLVILLTPILQSIKSGLNHYKYWLKITRNLIDSSGIGKFYPNERKVHKNIKQNCYRHFHSFRNCIIKFIVQLKCMIFLYKKLKLILSLSYIFVYNIYCGQSTIHRNNA